MSQCKNILEVLKMASFSLCKTWFLEGEMWPGRVFTHKHLSFISPRVQCSLQIWPQHQLDQQKHIQMRPGLRVLQKIHTHTHTLKALWQMDSCCRRVMWPYEGFKHHVWAVNEYYIKRLESFLVMNMRLCS